MRLICRFAKNPYICAIELDKNNKKYLGIMNAKWKIALLALLGLSTAACCSTKRGKKSDEPKPAEVEDQMEDPRIMLMYGVPFPDGQIARPVEDVELKEATTEGVPYHDGAIAHPVTDEQAQRVLEEIKAEEAKKAAQQTE